ncbi:MAG TPA: acyl-CoA thioesterase/bile acid-CoA:amino acid N-acyltransferase family protein [Candidatus Binataceae bacterium]|nr:acyl-CoA thioesterase/bile acid-CoA:amino acid N-acyltransferase family protein [Candidatus Binataceae bacterium]
MRIEADRTDTLYDQPIAIIVRDCPPGAAVTVRALAIDDLQHRWESHAVFLADADGIVDLSRQPAQSGSYPGKDAMGLFWSMRLDDAILERGPFTKTLPTPIVVKLTAEEAGESVSIEVTRRLMAQGVRRREIRPGLQPELQNDGIVATFFDHESGPRPGVIIVSGSGGGLAEDQPALLASRGYAVLSLAYFGMEGVSPELTNIPLEYFGRAIDWMRTHQSVYRERIAIMGASRGGELSLLLGATFPALKAVVAYVPSGVVWPGLSGTATSEVPPAWTRNGKGLAFMPTPPPDVEAWSKPPVVLTPTFHKSMSMMAREEWPEIEVERTNGPILMFSGSDDQMWPSLALADIAAQRLLKKNFAHRFEHITYAGAGHLFRFPYSPVISEIFHPVVRVMMALGGSPVANAAAERDSWERLLSFLAGSL